MPELPDMEHYKLMLSNQIVGKTITEIQVNRLKSINIPAQEFLQKVNMHKINRIERRAKHLLFYLENGLILLLHLMLGGWMFYGTEEEKPDRTIQIRLSFGGKHLYFIGLRLGYLHLHNKTGIENVLFDLGPEPLSPEFTEAMFLERLRKKRGKIKSALIDQKFIAGIGNRYSDEICYYAQILPSRDIDELTDDENVLLFQSIKRVLVEAILKGGYIEHPLFKGDTLTGYYEPFLIVHGREGEKCPRCGSIIKMEKISSHKTYFC